MRKVFYLSILLISTSCFSQVNTGSYFNFNNVLDVSGNDRHLTLGGQVPPAIESNVFLSGRKAFVFNGKTQLVAEKEKFLPTPNYTFEFRIKRDITHLGETQVVFGLWGANDDTRLYVCYFDNQNILTYYQLGNGFNSVPPLTSSAPILGGNYSIAIVNDGTNISMFVNGHKQSISYPSTSRSNSIIGDPYFMIGNYDDINSASSLPLYATIADFRYSKIARYTTDNYTLSETYFINDYNTNALFTFENLSGNYLSEPLFQGNILTRSGFPQASGGWANPDGLIEKDGKYFFTVSGYSIPDAKWTVWGVSMDNLNSSCFVGAAPIQSPASNEGDIAGNGSVIFFNQQFYHYYHDNPGAYGTSSDFNSIKVSYGSNFNQAFSAGNIIFKFGTNGYELYADPFVRVKNNNSLIMLMIGTKNGTRYILSSESSDGMNWSTPYEMKQMSQAGFTNALGEPSFVDFNGSYIITSDAAPPPNSDNSPQPRSVMRWLSKDGHRLMPLGKLYGGSGGDYQGAYDSSPFFDKQNSRIIYLSSNSTNAEPTQPTNSDIGMWYININSFCDNTIQSSNYITTNIVRK